jgi:hypothetical protein
MRTMPATSPPILLAPQDVLLFRGTGLMSKLIILLDGSPYSHAGLYWDGDSVAEALGSGLTVRPLAVSEAGHTIVTCARLAIPASDMSPVHRAADRYVATGERYAYEQILLLGFLCLTRKLPFAPSLKRLVRKILDQAAELLNKLAEGGKQPLICSEFVFRAYDEADPRPHDAYEIEVDGTRSDAIRSLGTPRVARGRGIHPDSILAMVLHSPAGVRPPSDSIAADDATPLDVLIDQYFAEIRSGPPTDVVAAAPSAADVKPSVDRFALALTHAEMTPRMAVDALGQSAALSVAYQHLTDRVGDFVTPGDLYRSQSLHAVGDLVHS